MRATGSLRSAALLCGLFILGVSAQTPKLPEPYQTIFDLAHGAPPEFAADALLGLAESGKIARKEDRQALIEEAFRLAGSTQYRMPLRALPGYDSDSRPAFLNQAYRLKLDALSLQTRAVRGMLAIDKPKARALFGEIAAPALPALSCDDALVPDAGDFYQVLGLVVDSAFSDKERGKEEHINFLLSYLARVDSPAQLAPVARLIKSISFSPDQRDAVVARFNAILETLSGDDRSFSATVAALQSEITPEMSAAFDKYLQRGVAGTRCKDSLQFTAKLAQQEAGPAKTEGLAKVERYWESDQAKRIFRQAQKLRFSASGSMLTNADRSTQDWNRQLTDFLKDLADWSASQEKSEADFYHEKCLVYESLVDLVPTAEQRRGTLEAFIAFITSSNLQQQSPAEWFVHARNLYDRTKNTNAAEADKVLDAYQASGNPVLGLFATMEKVFGSKVPSWAAQSASTN